MSTDVTAGNRGLTQLYRVVKQVAPKKGRRELQLRGAQGMPLMASQEVESGAKFYEELYLMPRAANKAQWPGAEMPQLVRACLERPFLRSEQTGELQLGQEWRTAHMCLMLEAWVTLH